MLNFFVSRSSNSSAMDEPPEILQKASSGGLSLRSVETPTLGQTVSQYGCLSISKELAANKIVTLDVTNVMTMTKCLEEKWTFSPKDVMAIYKDVAQALAYLHKAGVVHGAVCPNNILIYKYNGEQGVGAFLAGTKYFDEVNKMCDDGQTADDVRDLANVIDLILQKYEKLENK